MTDTENKLLKAIEHLTILVHGLKEDIFELKNRYKPVSANRLDPIADELLSFDQAAKYTGYSRSYLYKLTSAGKIPYSKPTGKMLYFDKRELDLFLRKNHSDSLEKLQSEAANYISSKK